MAEFPRDVEDFAGHFVALQEKRHAADYDPTSRFTRTDVNQAINTAERAIRKFRGVDIKDRKAFSVWVIMKKRSD